MTSTLDPVRDTVRDVEPESSQAPSAGRSVRPASLPPRAAGIRRLLAEQATVLAAQGISGLGNLAFLLIAARLAAPAQFAHLATFLALYLVVLMPALGFSAATSAGQGRIRASARRIWAGGLALGAVIAVAAVPIGAALGLPAGLIALLGAAVPMAAPLAIARGRLYGLTRPIGVATSLVVEPVTRLTAGVALLTLGGAVGGAAGVVGGGYLAFAVATLAARRARFRPAYPKDGEPAATPSAATAEDGSVPAARRGPWLTVAGFTLMAIVQNQDLVWANGLLPAGRAAQFAALSAIGGIAAFATSTIPLVLLPRLGGGRARSSAALRVALGIAVGLGAAAVAAAAVAPPSLYADLVGARFSAVADLAALYLFAMGLLGVARVLGARLVSEGRTRTVVAAGLLTVGVQAVAILLSSRTPHGIAVSTLIATAVLTAALAAPVVLPRPAGLLFPAQRLSRLRGRMLRREVLLPAAGVLAVTGVGLAIRLVITRGLWLDEATSVSQANMSFGGMLDSLRYTDVHPPGYFTLLWGWVRVFGDGPLSVRMPSIIIGTALIPVLWGAARDIYGRRTAWVVAGLATIAPQLVWYSQEARMYSLFALLVVLAVWAQVRICRTGSGWAWLGYTLASAAMLWTQYFTILVVLTQQAVFAGWLLRRHRRGEPVQAQLGLWFASAVGFCALVAPLVPFVHQQFVVNQHAGKGFGGPQNTGSAVASYGRGPVYVVLANAIWAVWGYHSTSAMTDLGALWPGMLLLLLLLLGRGRSAKSTAVIATAAVPVVLLFLVGTQKRFLFDLRYFIGVVPLVVLLIGHAVTNWGRRPGVRAITAGLVGLSFAVGLVDQQVNGQNPRRYDFQPALATLASQADSHDQVILSPGDLMDVSRYYQPGLRYVPATGPARPTVNRTAGDRRVFLVGSFFDVGNEKEQLHALTVGLEQHRHLVRTWSFANVKIWEFS